LTQGSQSLALGLTLIAATQLAEGEAVPIPLQAQDALRSSHCTPEACAPKVNFFQYAAADPA